MPNLRFVLLGGGWLLLAMAARPALAEPPELRWVFPSGVAPGTTSEIQVDLAKGDWPLSIWTSQGEITAECGETKGLLRVSTGPHAEPGLVWIRLFGPQGAAPPFPLIVSRQAGQVEVEPNNLPRNAQAIESPQIIDGRLDPSGDVDTVSLAVAAGQTLVAAITANESLDSPLDAVLQVVSPDGFVLAQNDDAHGLDPLVTYTAKQDGPLLVRVFGFPAQPNQTIGLAGGKSFVYRLWVTTGPFVDHCRPWALATGEPVELELGGWNLPVGARLSAAGAAGLARRVLEDAGWAGRLELPVVEGPQVVEPPDRGPGEPLPVPFPCTVTGNLSAPEERDAYRFEAPAGTQLELKLESRSEGFLLDAVVELRDAAGTVLARVDDAGNDPDPRLVHALPADGAYQVVVSDLYGGGGPRFPYRLKLSRAKADFALSVETHALAITPGQPLEIPVSIERIQGMAEPIEIQLLGLPPGVTTAAVQSPAEGDASKAVRLTVEARPGPWSGPVRVVGRAGAEGSAAERLATAPLPDRRARTSDLWLTVLPAP